MKTVLLTGAAGFVGANLARRLLERGDSVHVLLRPGYIPWRLRDILDELHVHMVDLRDRDLLQQTVDRVKPEWVFHLAAHGAYSWQDHVDEMVATNVNGTVNLVEACLKTGFEHFVNSGSSSEYGLKEGAPSEDERLDPNSQYAVTKAFGTQYCRYVGAGRQRRITTLRLYSVYGPFEEPKRFVPTLLVKGLHGQLPPLVHPETARDFVFIDDVAAACLCVAGSDRVEPGAVFNVGTGVPMTVGRVVEIAREILGIQVEARWGTFPSRAWDTTSWVANIGRIRSTLGWTPQTDLRAGLQKTLDWFRSNPGFVEHYLTSLG